MPCLKKPGFASIKTRGINPNFIKEIKAKKVAQILVSQPGPYLAMTAARDKKANQFRRIFMRNRNYRVLKQFSFLLLFTAVVSGCTSASSSGDKPGGRVVELSASGPIRSDYKVGEVTDLCNKAIADLEVKLNAISTQPAETQNIKNTLLSFEEAMATFSDQTGPLTFMGYVSTNKDVSAEGSDCELKIGQFSVDIFTRRPLFKVLNAQKSADPSEQRLLSQTILSFEQNGLKLSDEVLEIGRAHV